jgi:hypothetical protein
VADNVTLFGESAGGLSACAQLTAPGAAGLFHRAIIESGSCETNWPKNLQYPDATEQIWWWPRHQIEATGRAEAAKLGCGDLTCLRTVDVLTLQKATRAVGHAGYGTSLLPLDPRKALTYGAFNQVPVMQGNTRDEQAYFGWLFELNGKMDAATYRQNLVKSFGDQAAAVEKEYPPPAYDSPIQAWNTVGSDRGWICPSLVLTTLSPTDGPRCPNVWERGPLPRRTEGCVLAQCAYSSRALFPRPLTSTSRAGTQKRTFGSASSEAVSHAAARRASCSSGTIFCATNDRVDQRPDPPRGQHRGHFLPSKPPSSASTWR